MKSALRDTVYEACTKRYGTKDPPLIEKRLKLELDFIERASLEEAFLIAQEIFAEAEKEGSKLELFFSEIDYSFVAFLLGITEMNPLPPHYYCPVCKTVEFSQMALDGYDLPERKCTSCGTMLQCDGHDLKPEWFTEVTNIKRLFNEIDSDIKGIELVDKI